MCIAPILMKNPYYRRGFSTDDKQIVTKGRLDYLHNTIDHYVSVPCGRCSACVSNRQNYYVQRIQMESLRSELFYFTLTYANRGLKYTTDSVYKIPYPYYKDIQNLWKRLRKILPHPIRTFVVSEYGYRKKRPHFHGIIAVDKEDIKKYYRGSHLHCEKRLFILVLQNWKRNISKSHKFPVYMTLLDYVVRGKKRTYDLHWLEPILNHDNDTSFYVTKYIIKYDKRTEKLLQKIKLDPRLSSLHTKLLISQIKPRAVMSKDFGDYKLPAIKNHIDSCIKSSKDIPQFIDINTGKMSLLSPYYRKHCVSLDYYFERYWRYLHDVQYKNIIALVGDSYNPEYLDERMVSEINSASSKAQYQDKHLNRVKNLLNKI